VGGVDKIPYECDVLTLSSRASGTTFQCRFVQIIYLNTSGFTCLHIKLISKSIIVKNKADRSANYIYLIKQ